MEQLVTRQENSMVVLETLERRIQVGLNSVYGGIVEVGHCLIDAKELVEHGSWGEWLQRVSGLTERQAQRWMQIAKEIPADSIAAKLPRSHIQELLAAPEDKREEIAKKAVDESLTVKQLREEVAKANRRFDAMCNREADLKDKIAEADKRAKAAEARASNVQCANAVLSNKLKYAEEKAATGISLEAQAQIDSLKADLKDAQDFASAQAEKRAAAQRELLDYKKAANESSGSGRDFAFDAEALRLAASTFMAVAGILPHMGDSLALIGESERAEYMASVDMVAAWVKGAVDALNTVRGEVI